MARILIVDDSFIARNFVNNILVKAGHEVVAQANNSQSAFSSYCMYRPDIVTMDITMPGSVDGVGAVKQIKDAFPNANIIMISAGGTKQRVFEALQNGAKNFIVKPVTEEKLLAVVDDIIAASGKTES